MIIAPKVWTTILEKYMWLFNVIKICVGKDINVGKISEGVEESSDSGRDGELDECAWNASCTIWAETKYNE